MAIVQGILEVVDLPWYDTVGLPTTRNAEGDIPPAEFFQVPFGGMGRDWTGTWRVKTELDTNMMESGRLPVPHRLSIRSIRVALIDVGGGLMPVSSRYYRGAVLELQIGRKRYWQSPLWKVADPATMFLSAEVLKAFSVGERHELIRSLRHQFDDSVCDVADGEPIRPQIQERESFLVTIDFDPSLKWESTTAPGAAVVLLEGLDARAVQ
jgi:hypothetical protein